MSAVRSAPRTRLAHWRRDRPGRLRGVPLLCLAGALCATLGPEARAQADPESEADEPFMLDPLVVTDGEADPTGFDRDEAELSDPVFSNTLIWDIGANEGLFTDLEAELSFAAAARADAAALAAGSETLDLRGFPSPLQRDGFSLGGIPEVINPSGSQVIVGALVPVVGRAAPGGIRNLTSARPGGRPSRQINASASTNQTFTAGFTATDVVKPRRAWLLTSASVTHRDGPQRFAEIHTLRAGAALALRHSATTSTLWQLDATETSGNPAPGIPDYRATPGGPVLGPYRPLADFHTQGPNAHVGRGAVALTGRLDSQITPDLALASATQLFHRDSLHDRFTVGQYIVSTGVFSGVREPLRRTGHQTSLAHQTELTRRFNTRFGDHRVRLGVEAGLSRAQDEERGLTPADRLALLPLSVRRFDPDEPDYFRPDYSDSVYRRIVIDRATDIFTSAVSLDSRSAFNRGRTVIAAGMRYRHSLVEIADDRPGAAVPEAARESGNSSFHLGVNQRVGARYLIFANTSSAFAPTSRVDARTGAIQPEQSTAGVELGARALFLERRMSVSAFVYRYSNSDIARLNPLYNDPVADPNQTQPQLVASGEEEFRGLGVQTGWRPTPEWTLTARASWTDAVTVSSPDIPEEEGKPLARVPAFAGAAALRRQFNQGSLRGLSLNSSVTYIGETVQNYERPNRARLDFPGYTLVSAGAAYSIPAKNKKPRHTVTATVSNLLDEDLVEKAARVGAERSLTLGWRVEF